MPTRENHVFPPPQSPGLWFTLASARFSKPFTLELGMAVGATRWPLPLHSGLNPWQGTVLSAYDKRAWAGTIAFPGQEHEILQEAIDRHVDGLLSQGLLQRDVPVLWQFDSGARVYWSDAASLTPYAEDVRRWNEARGLDSVRQSEADEVYANYEFGPLVRVVEDSGWEWSAGSDEWTRMVYVDAETGSSVEDGRNLDDNKAGEPSQRLRMVVRFEPNSAKVAEAYASDSKGSLWGRSPVAQQEEAESDGDSLGHQAPRPTSAN